MSSGTQTLRKKKKISDELASLVMQQPLWELGIAELEGHNIEAAGRWAS